MLRKLRSLLASRLGSALALGFVILVALAFALGDIGRNSFFGGVGGGDIARVDGHGIPVGVVQQDFANAQRRAQRDNPHMDRTTFARAGGLDSVIDQLINSYVMVAFGKQTGIGVSKRMVDGAIADLPGTQGVDGQFDPKLFAALAAQNGLTVPAIRAEIEREQYGEQLLAAAQLGAAPGKALVAPYVALTLEKRSGQVIEVPSRAFLPKTPPSDAAIAAFYNAHSAMFMLPEQRQIDYATFDRAALTGNAKPTDAEIAAYYTAHKADYAARETRDITHLILPTQAAAEAAAAKVRTGQALDSVAKADGLDAVKTTAATAATYAAATADDVAHAAFALPKGQVAIVHSALGWYVIHVRAITQQGGKDEAAAKAEIADQLTRQKANAAATAAINDIQDAFANGQSLADVAKARALVIRTTPFVTAAGVRLDQPGTRPDPALQKVIAAGFQIDDGGTPQLVEVSKGATYAIVMPRSTRAAAPAPLDKIKPAVTAALMLQLGHDRAKVAAEAIRKAIAAGTSPADAVRKAGAPLPPPIPLSGTRLALLQRAQGVPPPLAMMFTMAAHSVKLREVPQNQGYFIVKLDSVDEGNPTANPAAASAIAGQFRDLYGDEYGREFVADSAQRVGVKRNAAAIKALRAQLGGTAKE